MSTVLLAGAGLLAPAGEAGAGVLEGGEEQEEQEEGAEPVGAPCNPRDVEFFLNCVDFCCALLPVDQYARLFDPWALHFAREMIKHAAQHTWCSGFPKLVGLAFRICSLTAFFGAEEAGGGGGGLGAGHELESQQSLACRRLFVSYVRETATRLTQYKDEMLCASIYAVLRVPVPLLPECIDRLLGPMTLALQIGLGHPQTAAVAVSTLELWLKRCPRVVEPHLKALLPCLNDYLRVGGDQGFLLSEEQDASHMAAALRRKSRAAQQGARGAGGAEDAPGEEEDAVSTAEEMRLRILQLLGRLGEEGAHIVGDEGGGGGVAQAAAGDNGMAWYGGDESERVRLRLPFAGTQEKPEARPPPSTRRYPFVWREKGY